MIVISTIRNSKFTARIICAITLMVIATMVMYPTTCSAQIEIGVVGGVNIANQIRNPAPESDVGIISRRGLILGVTSRFQLTDFLMAEIQSRYVQRGVIDRLSLPRYDVRHLLDYIEFPLLAEPFISISSQVRLYGGIGVNVSTPTSYVLAVSIYDKDTLFDEKSTITPLDIGLDLRLGSDYQITRNTKLTTTAEYMRGLINIYHKSNRYAIANDFRLAFGIYYQFTD